jgi:hypothetical protein
VVLVACLPAYGVVNCRSLEKAAEETGSEDGGSMRKWSEEALVLLMAAGKEAALKKESGQATKGTWTDLKRAHPEAFRDHTTGDMSNKYNYEKKRL